MLQPRHAPWLALALLSLLGSGAFALAWQGLQAPVDRAQSTYVGSDTCKTCHPQHHASWHRTFHRTMTQLPNPQSVLGDFERGELRYGGVVAHMRTEQQRYVMRFSSLDGTQRWRAVVSKTVGSHRYQQYLTAQDGVELRLPVAWDIAEARWVHMNGMFLTPDPERDPMTRAVTRTDYDRHLTRWDDNCIFCHNVAPSPGMDAEGRFHSTTAELGVACEACHGPGADHVANNRNPFRRYALHLSSQADPTTSNPTRMDAERSREVCGRCHGQRKTRDMNAVLAHGDRFIPGTNLDAHSTPLSRDTTLNGVEGVFAARFWRDGTPRLTAYEHQGVLLSACAKRGALSCQSCHAMHEGLPAGQLRPDLVGRDAMCTQCHAELGDAQRQSQHTGHKPSSAGSECRNCHMPRSVYGLVGARISHRIETPDPGQTERPDACTLCHVIRHRGFPYQTTMTLPWSDGDAEARGWSVPPESARLLFGGDPIERALAADALGRDLDPDNSRAQRVALLWEALADDRYPAVRRIARRSLLTLLREEEPAAAATLSQLDAVEPDATVRTASLRAARAQLRLKPRLPLAAEQITALRSSASTLDIEIGE